MAIDIGKEFKGSVATLSGQASGKVVWISNITTDWHTWNLTGNDLRTIGLWKYKIPTLAQVSVFSRTQFYLATTAFLSRPEERQILTFPGLTIPHPKMLPLWGVRYVIDDKKLPLGAPVLEMPFETKSQKHVTSPLRLYEFPNVNIGQYSPTNVIHAISASDILVKMSNPTFDGQTDMVTSEKFETSLVQAEKASVTIIKGGFRLRGKSRGSSVLVLPIQYSHCWVSKNDRQIKLFRTNLMQLGVYFEESVDADFKYEFGPFWNSSCRSDDADDAKKLDMMNGRDGMS